MARIRTLKPSFWSDAKVAGLSRDSRLLTVGLISFADDEGRFVASLSAIAGYVFPHDDINTATLRRWRDEVARSGLIELYQVAGREYGWFPNWRKHQRISHPQSSTLPEPVHADLRNDSRNGSAPSSADDRGTAPRTPVTGREGKGRGTESSGSVDPPRSEPDAREKRPGEDLAGRDADELATLVAAVRAERPRWTADAVADAARRAKTQRGATLAEVHTALVAVAKTADSTHPGRVLRDGPWWPTPPTPTPPPARERLAGTPELDPERNRRGRSAVDAALAARKPSPEPEDAP